jgi:hypothetical protein
MMRTIIIALIAVVALAVAGCGGTSTKAACITGKGYTYCSKPGCITSTSTKRELCGTAAVDYCTEAKPDYRYAILHANGELLNKVEIARKACALVGVNLNS